MSFGEIQRIICGKKLLLLLFLKKLKPTQKQAQIWPKIGPKPTLKSRFQTASYKNNC
jgi:hypothetical protein